MALSDIESAFLDAAADIDSIRETHDIEPKQFDALPAISMLFESCPQVVSSTGYSVVTWTWRVSITVPLNTLREAQEYMKDLIPQVMAITRADPQLASSCDWAEINDRQEPPHSVEDMRAWRKDLFLTAQTTESVGP